MKKLNTSHILSNIFLTALLTLSGLGCIATAFDLNVAPAALLSSALIWSALFCLGLARIWSMIPLVLVLAQYLWQLSSGDLPVHLESFLWNLSTVYDQAYDLGYTIWWTTNDHLGADTTALFQFLAVFSALITGAGLTQRRIWPGILMGVGMLIPCCIVTNMAPNGGFLLLWILSVGLLVLSASARRRAPEQTARFLLQSFLPVLLSLLLLFAAVPQESYIPPENSWLIQWLESLQEDEPQPTFPAETTPNVTGPADPGPGELALKNVNLSTVGPKKFSVSRKFTLVTDYSGYAYLRGTVYTTYTGLSWYAKKGTTDTEMAERFLQDTLQTTHIFYERTNTRLIPYYTPDALFTDGSVPLESGTRELEELSYPLIRNWAAIWRQQYGESFTILSTPQLPALSDYLDLPEETRHKAEEILVQIGCTEGMDFLSAAQAIQDYVCDSAEYSLQTRRMPADASDFALWFLENSETGYCIHFATAATVLLRAAGIPARYVEGYMVPVTAGQRQSVVGGNAHAWVEYYLPGAGWMILESTPGAVLPEITEPTEPVTVPTEPTTPTTEPSTTPTQPTPTSPTEPVVPPKPAFDGRILAWFSGILGGIALLWLQWKLRLRLRYRRLHNGNENRQTLARWRHACFLARLAGSTPPEELLALANKAKFSQHRITQPELDRFDAYFQSRIDAMGRKNVLLQVVYRFVLALY